MQLRFTKMNGAGNDFVMLNAVQQPIQLSPQQILQLADRKFGVGADQILLAEQPDAEGFDFRYRIFNADGTEVEHCGNGARCFFEFVQAQGLSRQDSIRVQTSNGFFEASRNASGMVQINMGPPKLAALDVAFNTQDLAHREVGKATLWELPLAELGNRVEVVAVSMGNPHAVQFVDDVQNHPVLQQGKLIETHPRFLNKVNAGFLQVLDAKHAKLRVYERGVGETLACGTGACAAMVAGCLRGDFAQTVQMQVPGGVLQLSWAGGQTPVMLAGPAVKVFEGVIDL